MRLATSFERKLASFDLAIEADNVKSIAIPDRRLRHGAGREPD
jgi:hypothetical protein